MKNDKDNLSNSENGEDSNNNDDDVIDDELEQPDMKDGSASCIEAGQHLKTYKSQLLLPKHKPLSKHFSLPSNFKIHPTSSSEPEQKLEDT